MTHERHQCVGVGTHQLEVLGCDRVRDRHRLLGPVDEHGVAALAERRLDVVAARSAGDEPVDGLR